MGPDSARKWARFGRGLPTAALRQAELARSLSSGLRAAAPNDPRYGHWLSDAWQHIGKAQWDVGRRDSALAAFRESAAVERQVSEQVPSNRRYRETLSRSYGRIAYYCGLVGDRPGAAAALLEQEKLSPGDTKQLQDIAQNFQKLANAVGNGRSELSSDEQLEQRRYVAEGQRLAEGARKAAAGRVLP